MYNRTKKDNYRKKIEELIGGRRKRSRNETSSSKANADNDDVDGNSNDIINDSFSDNSISNINEEVPGDISGDGNANKTYVQKWTPNSAKIEERLGKLEEKIDILTRVIMEMKDELKELKETKEAKQAHDFLIDVIKNVTKLIMSKSIYPTKAEMRGAIEAYLEANHSEFYNKFTEVQWTGYYNENIHKDVRSLRGSLSTKIREAIFATYGEQRLPSIKTNSSPSEISRWKKSPEVAACYNNLFKKMKDDTDSPRTISRIIEKVFLGKEYSNVEFSYVVAVCKSVLNPKDNALQLKESAMKSRVNHYLKKIDKNLPIDESDDSSHNEGEDEDEDEHEHEHERERERERECADEK